jgi:hypothetical protein
MIDASALTDTTREVITSEAFIKLCLEGLVLFDIE